MTLPLTKSLDPADYVDLAPEIALLEDRAPGYLNGQHEQRRWEYAMALRAWRTWGWASWEGMPPQLPLQLLDIGGAGSQLSWAVAEGEDVQCTVVDPAVNYGIEAASHIPDASIHAAFSVSTLEHVARPTPFLRAIHRVLAPGGLLFLTMDGWNCEGPDTAHFHWMRERIYNPESWRQLEALCTRDLGFKRFGGTDWSYHGDHVYNYSFFSLALTKES